MMEDEDNQSLIDDIRALENVLEPKKDPITPESPQKKHLEPIENPYPKEEVQIEEKSPEDQIESDGELVIDDDDYESLDCKDLGDLLELNKKMLELMTNARQKLSSLLEECNKRQRIVEEQISKYSNTNHTKIICFNAGMPYFKDKNYFSAPRNEDTKTKMKNGELRLAELQRIQRWSQHDKSTMLNIIKDEVIEILKNKGEVDDVDLDDSIHKTSQLPPIVREAIGSLGTMKFDWMKVSNEMMKKDKYLECRHSAEECEVMWNVFLHPDINKQRWTQKENKKLSQIVKDHNFEDWDSIAKELGTQRSGYQCFVRYNTNNWKNLMRGQAWSSEDDKTLTLLVSKLKIGDYIPWGNIASFMTKWTKQQVYFRWVYSLAPHLKKGRFSQEEDDVLLEAVEKYGQNFCKISALIMTNRTNIQLKDHYQTLTSRKEQAKKNWTLEEDKQLTELYEKYGTDWAKIITEMDSEVTRIQVRHRHAALQRYRRKGIGLKKITRDEPIVDPLSTATTLTYTNSSPWSRDNREILVKHLKIDDQLIKFFQKDEKSKRSKTIKSYDPDDLKRDTRKIHQILTKMGANLEIPECIIDENSELTEMDLELLSSLENYTLLQKLNANENVEFVRQIMFGQSVSVSEKDRFVPSLPFGFCNPRPTKKQKKSDTIDCFLDTEEYHHVDVEMELKPNKLVSEYIDEDTDNQFEKLKRILTESTKPKKVFKIRCQRFANSYRFEEIYENPDANNSSFRPPGVSRTLVYDWDLNKMIPLHLPKEEKFAAESVPLNVIEPTRSLLQGFQELLFNSQNFPTFASSDPSCTLTVKGREAMQSFKRRYQQLFTIPIGLSRIVPPDTVDESAFLPVLEKLKKKSTKRKRGVKKEQSDSEDSVTYLNEDDDS
ncbi:hypothetical protein QAD02_000925 [Eretmocerus hayati]|uniref:Uncharacterized protein n=1 Tax=Eretmocerus hayati TaxID=131215 RepID=A0ACC2NEZ0_9HYME|nr:hypothetical protein QAD02_000925 [Eretmocerus hayati]